MLETPFDQVHAAVRTTEAVRDVGRVTEVSGSTVTVAGLGHIAAQGDQLRWISSDAMPVMGEIIRLGSSGATVLMDGHTDGMAIGDRVQLIGPITISPGDHWIGRIVDSMGQPLDGRPLLPGLVRRPLQSDPMPAAKRRKLGRRLSTGMAVFNTLLPIVSGQRIGLFSGSGVGKSRLLGELATGIDSDVVVIALAGERGREVREFVDTVMGPDRMGRCTVVAATSDQSPLARRRCLWTAMAAAEHFRDEGKQVLLLADSVTRFAEAHREIALSAGENSSLRGYPPSVASLIMSLAECAGPGADSAGDITAIFTVLVAGSNLDEPISDILRGVLDGHVVLERSIAERGRFPAINLLRSVSRSLPDAASLEENALIARARHMLGVYEGAELMIQSGLYSPGSDPQIDAAIRLWPLLDSFVAEKEPEDIESSFARLAAYLGQAGPSDLSEGPSDVDVLEDGQGGVGSRGRE